MEIRVRSLRLWAVLLPGLAGPIALAVPGPEGQPEAWRLAVPCLREATATPSPRQVPVQTSAFSQMPESGTTNLEPRHRR